MQKEVVLFLWSIVLCGIILSACGNKSTQEHYDSLREVSEVRQLIYQFKLPEDEEMYKYAMDSIAQFV